MSDLLGIGTAISGVANAISTGVTNKKNRKFQRNMWDAQNAYNTPLAQRQRMEQAGFNPNMMYGSGTVANTAGASNVPEETPIDFNDAIMGSLARYQDIKSKRVDMKMQEQNINNAIDTGRKIRAEAFKANLEGLEAWATLPENIKKPALANSLTQAGIVGQEAKTESIRQDIVQSKAMTKKIEAETGLIPTKQEAIKATTSKTKAETGLVPLKAQNMKANTALQQMSTWAIPQRLKNEIARTASQVKYTDAYTIARLKQNGYLDINQNLNVRRLRQDIVNIKLRNKNLRQDELIKKAEAHWRNTGLFTENFARMLPLLYQTFPTPKK